jgi:hypothetical protein
LIEIVTENLDSEFPVRTPTISSLKRIWIGLTAFAAVFNIMIVRAMQPAVTIRIHV